MPPVDPFGSLASEAAGKIITDAWTTAMLGLWNAGLWVLRLVLRLMDFLVTPDLSADGPGAAAYQTTFWLAGVLMLTMLFVQLGVAAIRRSGKSLATALIGAGQFVVVWAGWLGYGVGVVIACGGISRALMGSMLKVQSWAAWQPWAPFRVDDITDGAVATVLGLLGLLLWLAAIGHLMIMITRAGALIVLAAMTPAAAAGLVADAGRSWFWKSFRWFHAAAFTPVLMVLMLGVGVQLTTGVANGMTDTTHQAVGTALPGVLLILISCFAPLALFKLLAFVDPTTNSGAALRTGLAAAGGIQGLLSGSNSDIASSGSGGAGHGGTGEEGSDGDGGSSRSTGEAAAADTTSTRFTAAEGSLLRTMGGAAGGAAATVLGGMQRLASQSVAIGTDLTNQMGVGHTGYYPDGPPPGGANTGPRTADGLDSTGAADPSELDAPGGAATPSTPSLGPQRPPTTPWLAMEDSSPGGGRGGLDSNPAGAAGAAGESTGSGAAAGAADAAAVVPIVPV